MGPPELRDVPERQRFELLVDGSVVAWSDYRPAGADVILAHTEVAEGHEGEGLGGTLVRAVLEHVRAAGQHVIPTCPFAAAYIRRHPEYVDLVIPALRAQFA